MMPSTEPPGWPEHHWNSPDEIHHWGYRDDNGNLRCSGCGTSRPALLRSLSKTSTRKEDMQENSNCSFWTGEHELVVHHGNGPFSWSWELYTRDNPRKPIIGGGGGSWIACLNAAQKHGGFNINKKIADKRPRSWSFWISKVVKFFFA